MLKYTFKTTKVSDSEYIINIIYQTKRDYGWIGNMGRAIATAKHLQEQWPELDFLDNYRIRFRSEEDLLLFLLKHRD